MSPAELLEVAIGIVERLNPRLNAVVHKLYDFARARLRESKIDGPFAGVPYLLKDLVTMWEGTPHTNATAYMRNVVSRTDSEAMRRVRAAGFVLFGKTNSPENGWALTTEPVLYGATHNPWAWELTPGGSSGGSAAAVASGMVPIAEGGDGAGSIRVPAAHCGLVGLKPSRGRVPTAPIGDMWYGGIVNLCVSRTVRDTAAYLDVVAGALPGDPYTPKAPHETWRSLARRSTSRLRIGFGTASPAGGDVHPEVADAVRRAAQQLEQMGHIVEEHALHLDVPTVWRAYARMAAVQTAHAFELQERLVGRPVGRDDVEPMTWAILERGRSVRGVDHAHDVEKIRIAGRTIATDLAPYDAFVTPVIREPPLPLGARPMNHSDLDRYNAQFASDAAFAFPLNVAGLPGISLPLYETAGQLPIGVQIAGRYGDEATLLRLATALEEALPWRERRPPIHALST
ncbi:amidase [Pendulispora albinea]|uniref:Amidase n=1 Tax=Pendulispora albinea TaxID=2741071 RepID=A0ABZ2M1G5_9BACT